MINNHESNILERLKHPEREGERRRMSRNLFLRNIINSFFILLAVAAMVGIVVTDEGSQARTACYALGLVAVVVKMVEVVLRMPGMRKE